MILTARYVRRPRRRYACDWCERGLGPHIYLYGMADVGRRPQPLRYCVRCCAERMAYCAKIRAALALALAAADQEGGSR